MKRWCARLCAVAVFALLIAGCASQERRKVQVIEEQRAGEVVEESPGVMIVE